MATERLGRTSPSPSARRVLRQFAEQYAAIVSSVSRLPRADLEILADCADEFTSTNCWWAEHRIVAEVAGEARHLLKHPLPLPPQ